MKIIVASLLLASSLPLFAQTAPASQTATSPIALTPELRNSLVHLGGQMMIDGKAYEYDRQLADEIGPRLTGSPNYVKAVSWSVDEFKRLGLTKVHREAWEIPSTWEPETLATARILAPHEQRLHLESEGWSPSTPVGGIRGNVYYIEDLSVDSVKKNAAKIQGTIVLVDNASVFSHIQDGFGKLFDALDLLKGEGATGLIFGVGATNNAPNMLGNSGFTGTLANIPCANLGEEDTLLLKRLLDKGPVTVEFSFKNHVREHVKVDNVVAEIPGSEANGEYIVIGGHLDSWQPGTGAQDNGTGAASVLAIAQAVKASGLTPRRTMRFILFGGEEEGLLGSVNYAKQHTGELEKCVGVFVTDTGAEAPKGWFTFGRKDQKAALDVIKPFLDSLGAGATSDAGDLTFETDEAPFLVHGVPSFVLWTSMEKYMQVHHKPSDTFDKVSQRDLNIGAAVVGITAYAFADASGTLPHYSATQLEEQLKSIDALTLYKDMQDHKMFQ